MLVKKDEHGDAEDLAEEKTIRAVFAQMKVHLHTIESAYLNFCCNKQVGGLMSVITV
jgi:hypothetical protein